MRQITKNKKVEKAGVYDVVKKWYTCNFTAGCLVPKSLYRSRAESHFYGTEYEIWADFGPVGNTEKQPGPIMSNFEASFFMFSCAKKVKI